MIITISGAACTGKTTLIDALQEKTKDIQKVSYYGEFIREMFDTRYSRKYKDYAALLKGDPMDIIDIHKATAKLFHEVMWSVDPANNILVFDRCPLDISIYLYMNLYEYMMKDENILSEYRNAAEYISSCSRSFLDRHPIMYYTRPFQEDIENDGFRPMSLVYRRSLELSLFDKEFLSLPRVKILPDGVDNRVSIINERIERALSK